MNFLITTQNYPIHKFSDIQELSMKMHYNDANNKCKWVYTLLNPTAFYNDPALFEYILCEIGLDNEHIERNFFITSRVQIPELQRGLNAKETFEYGVYKYYKQLDGFTSSWFDYQCLLNYLPNITLFRIEKK